MKRDETSAFFLHEQQAILQSIGKKKLLEDLGQMLLIRNFEQRGELAYQHGLVGGFYHSYMGQEAIQTAALRAFGPNHWWIASYRCHALALLLGATPNEIMAELFGRANGNAHGHGGSMHLYHERMLGGFGIVAGQVPIATGAAFALKYQKKKDEVAICFLGDGAVAQGSFHESMNLASILSLPCIYVIENNQWGMGTAFERVIAWKRLAEDAATLYGMEGYTLDGMNYFNCFAGFSHILDQVLTTGRPVLVEVITERFRGHSISDPAFYRTKEELEACMERDPIQLFKKVLIDEGFLDEAGFKAMNEAKRKVALEAYAFAEKSPWPDPLTLEEGVFS